MSLTNLYKMPGHLLRRCQQISIAIFLEECKEIRPVDFAVLSALETVTDIDQITLSGLVAIDRSSIGRIVDRLEDRGLISRKSNPKDRRTKKLHITKKGVAAFSEAKEAVIRVQERILDPLTESEKRQFVSCLEKITLQNNDVSRVPMRDARSASKESS